MVQVMDKKAIDEAMDAVSDFSESNRRSDGWCERCISKQ